MDEKKKWAFWGAAVGAFLIVCLPSAYFIEALNRYNRYISGVEPGALRPIKVRFLPRHDNKPNADESARLDFINFSLKKPEARRVALIGDFNGWKDLGLALARQPDGRWELLLPLPKGRHRYLFLVDGKPELDAANPETAEVDGRKASVKVVQ